ncbi:MAG: mycofactocin-coupled SDR family oxidoreductase [Cellulomonas sp.]|uniref:mycofactocin-coupled SDR family oxidoreductase n=1 Tax=Cellulomonas sp. TaxID=40001 RepID=UPI0018324CDA|nr:mycofactocin-coupled SDR family oxidoreductase [Cellulomonas sp.]NMM18244.1 mycofactocin-coupled SDR family oxidoreductase [Cellulomonas sp.]NMM31078.1 mycofactocin-coupled SDR family oxidoreductase [Cellulomonas sp.]
MIDLTGQVALVTGAARGIGRATAVALAEVGAAVVVTDIARQVDGLTYGTATGDDLASTVAAIETAGGRAVSAVVDVRDHAALVSAVEQAESAFGGLDIVVANAGVASWPTSTWQATPEQWQTMIDVVLTGTWNTCRAAIPAILRTGRGGSIVMVGSTAAVKPLPTIGHYAAAKNGLVGLLKSLALELAAASIRVNAVHPGGTGTEMTQNPAAEHWQATAHGVAGALELPMPIHRMEAIDVAYAVRWLCSSEARYITGAQIVLDAGATLQ